MKHFYLGGGRDSGWREEFEARFGNRTTTHDPFRDSRQGAIYEFTNDDLEAIHDSDVVIGVVDYHRYTGLALEFGFAHALKKEIMLIWTLGGRVDSMMAGVASWVFVDFDEAFVFIDRRVLRD